MAYQHAHSSRYHQRHLRGTIKRCIAKNGNATRDESYQNQKWDIR